MSFSQEIEEAQRRAERLLLAKQYFSSRLNNEERVRKTTVLCRKLRRYLNGIQKYLRESVALSALRQKQKQKLLEKIQPLITIQDAQADALQTGNFEQFRALKKREKKLAKEIIKVANAKEKRGKDRLVAAVLAIISFVGYAETNQSIDYLEKSYHELTGDSIVNVDPTTLVFRAHLSDRTLGPGEYVMPDDYFNIFFTRIHASEKGPSAFFLPDDFKPQIEWDSLQQLLLLQSTDTNLLNTAYNVYHNKGIVYSQSSIEDTFSDTIVHERIHRVIHNLPWKDYATLVSAATLTKDFILNNRNICALPIHLDKITWEPSRCLRQNSRIFQYPAMEVYSYLADGTLTVAVAEHLANHFPSAWAIYQKVLQEVSN